MVLEEQIGEQQKEMDKKQFSTQRQDSEKRHLEEELSAVKKVKSQQHDEFIVTITNNSRDSFNKFNMIRAFVIVQKS
jgi:hypothetical protein